MSTFCPLLTSYPGQLFGSAAPHRIPNFSSPCQSPHDINQQKLSLAPPKAEVKGYNTVSMAINPEEVPGLPVVEQRNTGLPRVPPHPCWPRHCFHSASPNCSSQSWRPFPGMIFDHPASKRGSLQPKLRRKGAAGDQFAVAQPPETVEKNGNMLQESPAFQ